MESKFILILFICWKKYMHIPWNFYFVLKNIHIYRYKKILFSPFISDILVPKSQYLFKLIVICAGSLNWFPTKNKNNVGRWKAIGCELHEHLIVKLFSRLRKRVYDASIESYVYWFPKYVLHTYVFVFSVLKNLNTIKFTVILHNTYHFNWINNSRVFY